MTVLFTDDFESKYSFHPVEDFPAPEEYRHLQRVYPSKTNRGARQRRKRPWLYAAGLVCSLRSLVLPHV